MIRLYTAVGTFKFNKHGLPTIVCADREYGLTSMELVLWSCLSFRILTYDELRKEFYEKERELHVLSEEEFDQYLNRLLQRKLVVCGEDYVGVDALYTLIGHLQLQAVPNSIPVKLLTFVKLLLSRKVPLKTALCIFHSVRLDPLESQVMQLLKNQDLSAAEVILCNENHISHLKDSTALMEALYNDEETDYNTLVTTARTSDSRFPVLSAIANLYLKQQIVFQLI